MMRKIYKVYNEKKFEVKRSMRVPGSIPGFLFFAFGPCSNYMAFYFLQNSNSHTTTFRHTKVRLLCAIPCFFHVYFLRNKINAFNEHYNIFEF